MQKVRTENPVLRWILYFTLYIAIFCDIFLFNFKYKKY